MARHYLLLATALLIPFTSLLGAAALPPLLDDETFHQMLNEADMLNLRTALFAFDPLHEAVRDRQDPRGAVREMRISDPARADRLLRLARRQMGTGGGSSDAGAPVVTSTTTEVPPAQPSIGTTVFSTTTLPTPVVTRSNLPTPPPETASTPTSAPTAASDPAPSTQSTDISSSSDTSSTSETTDNTGSGILTSVEVVTGDATATAPGTSTATMVVTAESAKDTATSASASGSLQTPNIAAAQMPLQGAAVGLVGGVLALLL